MTLEIFLALFILILMVLVSIEDANMGFLLLLTLIPLQHKELFSLVAWDVLPIRIAFFGLLLTTFYRFYLWYRRYKKKETVVKFIKDPILILLVLLFLFRLFSLTYAQDPIYGFKLLAFFSTIIYLYILVKFLFLIKGFAFVEKSLWLYGFLAFITGLVALIQFYVFKLYTIKFGAIWDIPGHNPRVGSTFWDVNHYGAFVMSAIPVTLAFAIYKKGVQRFFWIFNSLFLFFILFITQSRSAWLGMGFSLLIFCAFLFLKGFKKYARYMFYTLTIILLSSILYIELSSTSVIKVYQNFMHTRLDSFDTHFILVRGAYEAYAKSPFIGSGYGNFNEAFRNTTYSDEYFFREKNIVNQRVPSHSIWGEIISETGFIGLILYSLIFVITISILVRGYFLSTQKNSVLSVALISSIISLLISGIFYTYNLEFFWLTVFMGVVLGWHTNPNLNYSTFFKYLHSLNYLPLFALSTYSFFAFFWDLGKTTFIDWDEAIYAEVAKNIVKSNDYLTLQWTLGTPWFEKPPFYMWLSSFFMQLLGFNELSARLPSAIFAVLTVVLVYFFGVKLFKSRFIGFLSGVILVTNADFWYYGRISMLDVTVTFFITATLFFAFLFFEHFKKRYAFLSGVFCGIGVLTKSVVGLLPLPIIFLYILYLIFFKLNFNIKKYLLGILLFLTGLFSVAFPWHFIMYTTYKDKFLDSYFYTHILSRGLTNAQGKTQLFTYYLERFRPSMRLWYLVLIPSFFIYTVYLFKNIKANIFIYLSAVVIFIFFSISKSKLIWYIIPLYPFLALICAYSLYEMFFIFDKYFVKFTNKTKFLNKFITIFEYTNAIGVISIALFFGIFLYTSNVQKLVFVPNFNSDKVKVLKVYNEKYASKPKSGIKALYYLRIQTPVVKFYTQGDSIPSDIGPFTNTIRSAEFTEPLVYISRQGEVKYFRELLGDDKVVVSYQAGAYYLVYVRSGEEYALAKIASYSADINRLIAEYNLETDLNKRNKLLKDINRKQANIYEQQKILHTNLPQKYNLPAIYFTYPELL